MPAKIDPVTLLPVPGTEWSVPAIGQPSLAERLLRVAMSGAVPADDPHVIADAVEALRTAVEQERRELARLFREKAFDHDLCAQESADADERDDEDSHKLEADVWRAAAALVSERGKPAPAKPEPEVEEEEDADELPF